MNSTIEFLNASGSRFLDFALPMLWQSSLLIVVIFALDVLLRRKVRALVRYTLWSVVLIKLILPPTLALPTGAAWWLRTHKTAPPPPPTKMLVTTFDEPVAATIPLLRVETPYQPPPPTLSREGWLVLISANVSFLLFGWLLIRWRQVARSVRRTEASPAALDELLERTRLQAGLRRKAVLRLTSEPISPAVCGLFRPVVLLPKALVESLPADQLRAVLLHELIHLRRRDVWMNCVQTMLQILYWWHPLLWIANARVRRVREEAVDDAVMWALNDEGEIYAPTLVEVARLAFRRPLASLGLVGILESRSALRHRVERLLNFTTPRRAGFSLVSILSIAAFTALAVPMGEAPEKDTTIDQQTIMQTPQSPQEPETPVASTESNNIQAGFDWYSNNFLPGTNDAALSASTQPSSQGASKNGPQPNVYARSNVIHTSAARQRIYEKLNGIRFDKISFNNVTLKEAIRILSERTQVADPEQDGINFILSRPRTGMSSASASATIDPATGLPASSSPGASTHIDPATGLPVRTSAGNPQQFDPTTGQPINLPPNASLDPSSVKINVPELKNARLMDVLEAITKNADWPIKYSIMDYGIEFSFRGTTFPQLFTRTFKVDSNAMYLKLQEIGLVPTNSQQMVLNFFDAAGISVAPPRSVFYNHRQGTITFHATEDELDQFEQLLPNGRELRTAITNMVRNQVDVNLAVSQWVQDGKLFYQIGKLDRAEQALKEALDADPNNQAALYYRSLVKQARAKAAVDEQNKSSGSMQLPNADPQELQKILRKLDTIKFDSISYDNVSLDEVIRDLNKRVVEHDPEHKGIRIAPSVTLMAPGYLIVPPRKNWNWIKINLAQQLKNARLSDVLDAIVLTADYPIKYSIDAQGIAFSYADGEPDEAKLFTRTFKVDPNTFFNSLKSVNVVSNGAHSGNGSGQVPIANGVSVTSTPVTREFMTSQEEQIVVINFFNAIGVNLAAPKSVFFNDRQGTLTVRATSEDLDTIEHAIETLNIPPPEVTVKARFVVLDPRGGLEKLLKDVLTNKTDGVDGEFSAMTGILTEPQFKKVLQALSKRDYADMLNEGQVTTLSGRQAQFQVVDVQTVVTDFKTTIRTNGTSYGYDMTNMPFGVTLDTVPTVLPDGYSISMRLIPEITEFLGYDHPPKALLNADKNLQHGQLPLPKYRKRQATTSVTVWDGQTVVIGNLTDEMVFQGPNGTQMHQPFKDTKKKQIVVFITPTIIDPSGNRTHSVSQLIAHGAH